MALGKQITVGGVECSCCLTAEHFTVLYHVPDILQADKDWCEALKHREWIRLGDRSGCGCWNLQQNNKVLEELEQYLWSEMG